MILTILKVIILLGFLVIIHEFAHMIVAKVCKVKVLEFSIGFGPLLLKKDFGDTTYSLRLIPLGGYVSMFGMDDKNCKEKGSYQNANILQKVLILLAGSFMNILFGLVIYFILACQLVGIEVAFKATLKFALSLFDSVKMLFTGGVSPDQLMGPIGITGLVNSVTDFSEFIYLGALISLSLGITNLIPIPPLDGSKILIVIFEAIRRKPLSTETEVKIQLVGFVFIILLSVFVAFNDIVRLM